MGIATYLALDPNMQLLEGFSFRHGRVESDLVKNRPVLCIVALERVDSVLGATDLGIDSLGRDVDAANNIHGSEIRQKVVLDLHYVSLGNRTKLIKGQGDIVLGGGMWRTLLVVPHHLSDHLVQFVVDKDRCLH